MKSEIKLAPGLSFPAAEFATEVVASLGARGGGKSNGAAVVAEGLLDAGVQVVVLDYVGIWFSLRLEPDGKTPSRFKIAVLGGSHGDHRARGDSGERGAYVMGRLLSWILDLLSEDMTPAQDVCETCRDPESEPRGNGVGAD